ncbi:MAG: hypothetical protein ABI743_14800, partial [bacterium]
MQFHNGVTRCPVCDEAVNLSLHSVLRFPQVMGFGPEEFPDLHGIYHRACFPRLPAFDTIVERWEALQRECFKRRNHSLSLFNNVVAFETERFLCLRYVQSDEHQLLGFPRLLDWHLNEDQLQTLYQFFLGLDEDTFRTSQQVFTT